MCADVLSAVLTLLLFIPDCWAVHPDQLVVEQIGLHDDLLVVRQKVSPMGLPNAHVMGLKLEVPESLLSKNS